MADIPAVGQNLMDHSVVHVSWDSNVDLPSAIDHGAATSLLNWKGTHSELEILPFVRKSGELLSASDVLKRPVRAARAMRGTSVRAVVRQIRGLHHAVVIMSVMQAQSRGTVTLRSGDPGDPPVLQWNLCSAQADRESFREATRVLWDLFRSPAMKEHQPEPRRVLQEDG